MPDALAAALAMPGLGWLIAAVAMAGVVRGFSGFGTAMIYLPVAAQIIPPVWAIVTLVVFDIFGPLPNLRVAWRDAQRADLARLVTGALVLLPVGLLLLLAIRSEIFRYAVSLMSLALLFCLLLGLRWRGPVRPPLVYATGGLSGFLGGVAGLPGPPVILLYMASPHGASVIRANTMLYLFFFDFLFLGLIATQGQLSWTVVVLGLMLAVPNLLGNLAGAAIFRPGKERLYRAVAYGIIAISALSGLPIWD